MVDVGVNHGLQASVFFFQAEDGIRDGTVTGVQTCAFRSEIPPGGGEGARHGEDATRRARVVRGGVLRQSRPLVGRGGAPRDDREGVPRLATRGGGPLPARRDLPAPGGEVPRAAGAPAAHREAPPGPAPPPGGEAPCLAPVGAPSPPLARAPRAATWDASGFAAVGSAKAGRARPISFRLGSRSWRRSPR